MNNPAFLLMLEQRLTSAQLFYTCLASPSEEMRAASVEVALTTAYGTEFLAEFLVTALDESGIVERLHDGSSEEGMRDVLGGPTGESSAVALLSACREIQS